jgi:hypothetical protein
MIQQNSKFSHAFLKIFLFFILLFLQASPFLTYGQPQAPAAPPSDFKGFVDIVIDLITLTIPVIVGLIFIVFLWGASLFILNAGNEEKRDQGRRLLFWGIIGLFVVLSVWALVSILTGSLGFSFGAPQLKEQ